MEKNDLILKNGITVLDFYAEWCGPCQGLLPIIDELKNEYDSNEFVSIKKINVDEYPEIATDYSVRGIPNLVFIKNGEVINRMVGSKTKEEIKNFIDEHKPN